MQVETLFASSAWFVGHPFRILAVGLLFLIAHHWLRTRSSRRSRRISLATAIGWIAFAGWEALVRAQTPEANIRVDLLLVWPLLVVLSAWTLVEAALAMRKATA